MKDTMMYNKITFRILFSCMLITSQSLFAQTWQQIFDECKFIMTDKEKDILIRQQAAFALKAAPIIASPEIKNIPIIGSEEKLIDLRLVSVKRIAMLPDAPTPFYAPTFNSGLLSGSKMRHSILQKLADMVKHIDSLAAVFGYQPGQIDVRVFEGLRDLKTQEQLFNNKKKEILAQNPNMTPEAAEQETSKWVSPIKNNVPVHSTGAAIDIRLWDNKQGDFLDMGSFGVIWGSNPYAPTFSEQITDAQKRNRLYCLLVACRAGLINYVFEFWHFSSGDRYAAYWQEKEPSKRAALFGPIAE